MLPNEPPFRFLRHHARKPPLANSKPGKPPPTTGPGTALKPVTRPWFKSSENAEKRELVKSAFLSVSRNSHLLESVPTAAPSNVFTVSTRLPAEGSYRKDESERSKSNRPLETAGSVP